MNRRIVTTLLVLSTAFTIYNTLLPFHFVYQWGDLPERLSAVSWSLPYVGEGRPSLTDLVGNVLLFIPFGFLMWLSLHQRGYRLAWPLSILAGIVLSLSIEIAQLFIPERHSALHDVINNMLGTLIGASAATIVSGRLSNWLARISLDLFDRQPASLLLLAIAAAQVIVAAIPFTVVISVSHLKTSLKHANLVPFDYRSVGLIFRERPNQLDLAGFDATIMIADTLYWTPVGWLLLYCHNHYWKRLPRARWLVIVLPLFYFPAIELMQLFIVSRVTDINSVLAGYAGIAFGAVLYCLSPRGNSDSPDGIGTLTIPVLLYAVFVLFSGLRPFDFSTELSILKQDLNLEKLIPFHAYFRKTSFSNLFDLVTTICYLLPLSLYWTALQRSRGCYFRSIYPTTILAGLITGILIEICQIFSASRVGDITDVLSYAVGGGLGTFLIFYFEQQVSPRLSNREGPTD